MSKKAMVSLLLIGLMAFGAGIGTYAWFTSQATSTGNTFTAGTLTVGLDHGDTVELNLGDTGNMQPGDVTEQIEVMVTNDGSLDLAYFGYFVVDENQGPLAPAPQYSLLDAIYIKEFKTEFLDPDGEGTWEDADHFIQEGHGIGYFAQFDDPVMGVMTLRQWMKNGGGMGVGGGVQTGALAPYDGNDDGFVYKHTIQFGFAPLAGNEYQGIGPMDIQYVVKATQVDAGALEALDNEDAKISIGDYAHMEGWYEDQIEKQVDPVVMP